ncbi:MAG: hypothetical protein QG604_25 [Candidatus Dependentiae bacterium]|nr:hypothetical protein [Candidatus Dependentiae bacterium]
MSTQLTISIELITFMQWVLTHKSDAFATFITDTIDAELKDKLALMASDKDITVSSDQLYETLSSFVRYIEHHIQATAHDAEMPARRAKKKSKHRNSGTHRGHAQHCSMRGAELSEVQSIQSPTQRVLYQALFSNEGGNEGNVH